MKNPLLPILLASAVFFGNLAAQDVKEYGAGFSGSGTITACEGIILKPGFTFSSSAGQSLRLKVDPAVCSPYKEETTAVSPRKNYVITVTPTSETDKVTIGEGTIEVKRGARYTASVQYYDGLGRPVQTVHKGASPGGSDLVHYVEYDSFGREQFQGLPVPIPGGSGAFVHPSTCRDASAAYYGDSRPYTEIQYDNSPLNRVIASKGPGEAWERHPAAMRYEASAAGEVKSFTVSGGQLECTGTYASGSLYKTTSLDEDGKSTTEYTDKLGQVVMVRRGTDTDTYYVYDDLGNKRYVLPPLAADALGTGIYDDSHEVLQQYAYVYKYDARGQNTAKRLPGCGWIHMVYDKAGRLVLSQDGVQRTQTMDRERSRWTVYKYDKLGRLLYTAGIFITGTLESWCDYFSSYSVTEWYDPSYEYQAGTTGYTRGFFHNQDWHVMDLLTVNYYDHYDFLGLPAYDASRDLLAGGEKAGFDSACTGPHAAKGLLTGTRVYQLDGSGNYTTTVYYYDYRGRIVQAKSTNHLGGFDMEYTAYDFTGNVLRSLKEHSTSPDHSSAVDELYTYTYDHAGRLLTTRYKLNNNTEILLASNEYDETGRLTGKKQHDNKNTVRYQYNIRNQLTKIQDGEFEQRLYYNTLKLYAEKCYNGNISAIEWTYDGRERNYNYHYDELNQLTKSYFFHLDPRYPSYPAPIDPCSELFSYDKQGNILTVRRKDGSCLSPGPLRMPKTIDDLSMEYNGNQLVSISDQVPVEETEGIYNLKQYSDRNQSGPDFAYDANGNMIKDLDRGITQIKYNILNLPEEILFENGNKITNLYAADGRKLNSWYQTKISIAYEPGINKPAGLSAAGMPPGFPEIPPPDFPEFPEVLPEFPEVPPEFPELPPGFPGIPPPDFNIYRHTGTEYAGNIEYSVSSSPFTGVLRSLQRIHNAEGYVNNNTHHYYRKDHLGSNREVWKVDGNTIATIQRTQYYPSGLPWAEGIGAGEQPYKAEGKEFIEMHGYDIYDSSARMFDPLAVRTTTPDPHCENYYSISPYAWLGNNFVNRIDPDGRDWYSYIEKYKDKNGEIQTRTLYHYVEGTMSEEEMEEGGYTHLGKTHITDDAYYSLGGATIGYDKNDAVSVLGLSRIMGVDNTIMATVNAVDGIGDFWEKYSGVVGMGSSAATMIDKFMGLSKGFSGTIKVMGALSSVPQALYDAHSLWNRDLHGIALYDAGVNLISMAGVPGAAISLTYNGIIKPGVKGINRMERSLQHYFKNAIINSNNLRKF